MINQSRIKQPKEIPALGNDACGDPGVLMMQPQREPGWSRAAAGQDRGARKEPCVQMEEHQEGRRIHRL